MVTIENNQETVIIACDGQPLLRYQAITPASKPHFDCVALPPTASARAGENIVLAAPHDRVWHLGLYFSPGVIDGVDFRDAERRASRGQRHGVCRGHGPVRTQVRDDGAVAFSHEIRWQTSDGESWLSEQREFVVHPPAGDAYRIDWKMTWTSVGGRRVWAAQDDSDEVGGLVFRALRSMADGALLTSSGQRTLDAVNGSNTRWCDYTGRLDGKIDVLNPDTAGVTFFREDCTPGCSHTWYAVTQPFGLLAACLSAHEAFVIPPDQPVSIRFGILVHAGEPDRRRIESSYWNFVGRIACPCCGYYGIRKAHDICPFCGWEHDPPQLDDPDRKGANPMSLRQAQRNFLSIGAKDERSARDSRKPTADDYRDPAWRPLD